MESIVRADGVRSACVRVYIFGCLLVFHSSHLEIGNSASITDMKNLRMAGSIFGTRTTELALATTHVDQLALLP